MGHTVRLLAVASLLTLTLTYGPSTALADDPPPAVGTTILEDPLSGPTLLQPFACRTQRGTRDYVDEGLRLKITGRCVDGDTVASLGQNIRGLTMIDGELRLEVKAVSGIDRAMFMVGARNRPGPGPFPESDYTMVEPGRGRAVVALTNRDGIEGERADLEGLLKKDDWNVVALRFQGPGVWLLVNDEAILSFADPTSDRGDVYFNLFRRSTAGHPVFSDDPNDTTEVAVVVRNLRVSALADGDPSRVPTYQRP